MTLSSATSALLFALLLVGLGSSLAKAEDLTGINIITTSGDGNDNCIDFGYDFGFKMEECRSGTFTITTDLESVFESGKNTGPAPDVCPDFVTSIGNEVIEVQCFDEFGYAVDEGGVYALIYHDGDPDIDFNIKSGKVKDSDPTESYFHLVWERTGLIASCDYESYDTLNIRPDLSLESTCMVHSCPLIDPGNNYPECKDISHIELCFNCPQATPSPTGAFGDPHFITWNNEYFDFMGECDLVLAESLNFGHGLGLTAHIRTKLRFDYSYIESAVLQLGDDILEVGGYGAYMLNGISNAKLPMLLSDQYMLTKTVKNDHDVSFDIDLGAGHGHVVVKAYKDLVSIRFSGVQGHDFWDVRGLMGSYGTGTRFARDGIHVMDDNNAFGQEWQVNPEMDPELFTATSSIAYPTPCRMPNPLKESHRRLGETISVEDATKACQAEGFDMRGAFEACVYDVMATGDLEAAKAGAF